MKYNNIVTMASLCRSSVVNTMKLSMIFTCVRRFSNKSIIPWVCVVGAGPAGFYAAQQLIKTIKNVRVDIVERLPVPFGLVRFGVAPDHPEVKNVINTFHKTAKNPHVQFLGNVNVGRDITVEQLRESYHAVILTYGAEQDKLLGIPGEDLNNVISGRRFVGWYNGVPADRDLKLNLNVEEVAVLGQGNVAIDIARILLTPIDNLKKTDITAYALEQLSQSKVRKVQLIGRRGPLQVAYTIAELRELIKIEKCRTHWQSNDFDKVRNIVANLPRPRRRLTELMLKSLDEASLNKRIYEKELHPIFLRSPVECLGTNTIERIKLSINELTGDDVLNQSAKPTGLFDEISCGLAFRSIGYKSVQIDASVPFDLKNGRVLNSCGKIEHGLYTAGWVATGPVGIILSTMTNAFQVAALVCKELEANKSKPGSSRLLEILNEKNVPTVSYENWEKIDKEEQERGKKLGKSREKIVDISEMLEVALS